MLGTPQITQTAAQETAVIRLTIPREEIRNVMGPGIGELMGAVAAQGIALAGPWFTHHLRMDEPGPIARDDGGAHGLPGSLRRPRRRLGRVRRLDRGQWAHAGPGPLGVLCRGPGIQLRPCQLAHGAQPATGPTLRTASRGPRQAEPLTRLDHTADA